MQHEINATSEKNSYVLNISLHILLSILFIKFLIHTASYIYIIFLLRKSWLHQIYSQLLLRLLSEVNKYNEGKTLPVVCCTVVSYHTNQIFVVPFFLHFAATLINEP